MMSSVDATQLFERQADMFSVQRVDMTGKDPKTGFFMRGRKVVEATRCFVDQKVLDPVRRATAVFVKTCTQHIVSAVHRLLSTMSRKSPLSEAMALAVHSSLYFLNLENLEPKAKQEVIENQTPVILVHGFLDRSSGWFDFREVLLEEGIKNVFSVNLGNPLHSIEDFADVLAEKVRTVKDLTGSRDVILVGHSMGGLVCREFRQERAEREGVNVPLLVTIGTPLQGTRVARLASWISRSAAQMLPGSSFLQKQQKWKGKESDETTYVHIASDADIMVPRESAFDGNECKQRSFITTRAHGHLALQMSQEVNRIILGQISQLKD